MIVDVSKTPYILRYSWDNGIYLAKIEMIEHNSIYYKILKVISHKPYGNRVGETTAFRLETAKEVERFNLIEVDEYKLLTEKESLVFMI